VCVERCGDVLLGRLATVRGVTATSARIGLVAAATVALATGAGRAETAKAPQHRIAVRTVRGFDELYDRTTHARFVPRGANYIRLDFSRPQPHVTFQVGRYDGPRAGRALAQMRADGYNAVRVFVVGEQCSSGCIGVPGRRAINRAYIRNVVDFLRRARANRIYGILTTGFVPDAYGTLIGQAPLVDNVNRILLTEGGIQAYAQYWRDLVRELRRKNAPLDAILAYDLTNENAFVNDAPPFTLSSGVVSAPNGKRYDLAQPGARDALMDDGMVYWVDRVRAAIRRVDPTALVTASFFEPEAPNPTRAGDTRILRTRGVIERSKLDFVDLHAYPGGLVLQKVMENFGVDGPTRKVVVIGETGAFKHVFATPADAAPELAAWQALSCTYGVDGWLVWTWDSDEQAELWNARSEGGAIEKALAPKSRADPCAGGVAARNLALGKPVSASASTPENPPALAVDGNRQTGWISGQNAPQWVEVDLGAATSVGRIRLIVSQYPAEGQTSHRVWARGTSGDYRLLRQLDGVTRDNGVLDLVPSAPWTDVRWVRAETVSSPSWVAWKEIDVFGAG
jgi:hypothetical protein